jgi:tRNA nucleotidyltransferase/poly(A) polymerase
VYLDFSIEKNTETAIKNNISLTKQLTKSKLQKEFKKLSSAKQKIKLLNKLRAVGLDEDLQHVL